MDNNDINKQISKLDNWQTNNTTIKKEFKFDSYMKGIDFVNQIAKIADQAQHHPDITIGYKKVTVTLTTHYVGDITQKDIDLAQKFDKLEI